MFWNKPISPTQILPSTNQSMQGAGVEYRGKKYITHSTLETQKTALYNLESWQKYFLVTVAILAACGLFFGAIPTIIFGIGILSIFYFFDALFNLFLVTKSLREPPDILFTQDELANLKDDELPTYTILCPLYHEVKVIPRFLNAIANIDWPKDKLEVLILLEEDDAETIAAFNKNHLPAYIKPVIVPYSEPKTKPKACNWGLSLARGEYLVIYDAEDVCEPMQLKKAYVGFKKVDPEVICLQAKLNYYNPEQNLLTRLFTAEYSLWFDVILTGLQTINTCIPLGGTSNHFKTADLKKLKGWDAFNVTEDADLGVRLFKAGYKTAIIDSTTFEEANSQVHNWLRQRSRWIKGYIQTYLVHMRDPKGFVKDKGIHAFFFQIFIGGKLAFMFINPILWVVTISYFTLNGLVGEAIEAVYPSYVFYTALTSFVLGNFTFMYYYMVGCAKRKQWEIIKYLALVPFYWLLISGAAVVALYQLITKPHYWEKTNHGLDFDRGQWLGQYGEQI